MDGKLWKRLYENLVMLSESKRGPRQQFADWEIVAWYLWAVLNDRPVAWLGREGRVPSALKTRRRPSAPTISRRLNSEPVAALLSNLTHLLTHPHQARLCKYLDGKPLPVGAREQGPRRPLWSPEQGLTNTHHRRRKSRDLRLERAPRQRQRSH